eukprot:Pompholyxophrys_sp_v1_NODE_383_length_633_cov_3.984429.p3 type:complete len:113 gc:universal NODE_383_length_633_cov_3.984429:188-526(+)
MLSKLLTGCFEMLLESSMRSSQIFRLEIKLLFLVVIFAKFYLSFSEELKQLSLTPALIVLLFGSIFEFSESQKISAFSSFKGKTKLSRLNLQSFYWLSVRVGFPICFKFLTE